MKKQEYTAIIPVRAGSRRLKNKNILPFADSNLLIHKIRQLKKIQKIDNIVVSSDSDEMLEMAKGEGVNTHKRPIEYADEVTKTFNEVVEYIVQDMPGNIMMWVPCVCPLCDEKIIEQAMYKYEEEVLINKKYDSLATAKLIKEYIWNDDGPINNDIKNHTKSQDLPNFYIIINGCFISSKINMLNNKFCYGNHPYMYLIDKQYAIDIDDEYDLAIARLIEQKDNIK
ncbi:hypothetical protein R4I97_11940 [Brachyspira pilosicoli]|uniref:acylneuraminate cytidylyltransferase family protein n=1 Tax=Brachyspira pilosicoli TaxID=52584 RepID=UPI0030050A24